MQKSPWHFRALVLFFALSGSLFAVPVAPAQVRIPATAIAQTAELDDVLQRGRQLETDQRWGEALSHYENALKLHPGESNLEQRVETARIHLDLARRYADSSFLNALHEITEREAADMYAEVLLKIQAHYVHTPNWQSMVLPNSW